MADVPGPIVPADVVMVVLSVNRTLVIENGELSGYIFNQIGRRCIIITGVQ